MSIKTHSMKLLLTCLLFFVVKLTVVAQIQNTLDSADYNLLYKNIAKRIEEGLYKAKHTIKNESILFSIRFNLDKDGNFENIEGSRLAPLTLVNSLKNYFRTNTDTSLKRINYSSSISKNYILVPIVISPQMDTALLGVNYPVGINMVRDMYIFSNEKSKENDYYHWYPPFYAITFTPVTYPYTYKSPYADKYKKYYKKGTSKK